MTDVTSPPPSASSHGDVIADERAGNTHQSTRDDAAGRSGELAGQQDGPATGRRKAGDDAGCKDQKNVTTGSVARLT
jgi:hypothetical protein